MLKYQFLFAFTIMKKMIAIFTFVNLTSKFKNFASCFTKFIISRISGNFRGNFVLKFMPKFLQAKKLFKFSQGMYFSLKSFNTFFRLPKITSVKTHLKSRLNKKRGRPSFLPEDLMTKVISMVLW